MIGGRREQEGEGEGEREKAQKMTACRANGVGVATYMTSLGSHTSHMRYVCCVRICVSVHEFV